ncbi:hypothetical protein ACROYT_G014816 [Oculina patagonica]
MKKKKKDWNKVLKRGKTSSTHETDKLHYRADVLRLHHDYNVIVLMHRKHGGGHNIHKYGTPGVAYDFVGDNSTKEAPCREGQLFINLYASFCEVPDILKSFRFDCQFSPGGFVRASQENSKKPCLDETFEEQENNSDAVEDSSVLFSCPNEGCVKVYQRYSSLEKHMSFGKCKMLPEKGTLLDKAKKSYHILLQEDVSSAKALETTEVEATEGARLPEGWALKTAKKPKRLSEAQRKYLADKFNLGQETGHKQNPEQVSKDMDLQRRQTGRGCSPKTIS